ncbi:MAG: trimeric intracellular cation channel family protein [Paludibacteraceae bacterium]|nr:trimeric intracellular cation channel family protein [Paludibacteraceae bacterium]
MTLELQDMNIGLSLVEIIDYLGTFAFAISGLRLASQKQFDLYGAAVVGMVTAVGGGTLRDLMLGLVPFWMTQWSYIAVVMLALILFTFFHRHFNHIAGTIFLFDTIGLALFTVVGFQKTLDAGYAWWAAILMGMITGAVGGVIRDILINEVPLIFRSDIYALACIAGGLLYSICLWLQIPIIMAQLGCAITVVVIRLLAVRFHWQLPILKE